MPRKRRGRPTLSRTERRSKTLSLKVRPAHAQALAQAFRELRADIEREDAPKLHANGAALAQALANELRGVPTPRKP